MSLGAETVFEEKIDDAIKYMAMEYDMSHCQVIGCLVDKIHQLLHINDDRDEDEESTP